jgi:hypothetical protein
LNQHLHLYPPLLHLQHSLSLLDLQPDLPVKLLLEVCDPPAVLEHLTQVIPAAAATLHVLDVCQPEPANPETQGGAGLPVQGEGGEEGEQVSEG